MTLPPRRPTFGSSDRKDRIVGSGALLLAILITVTTLWVSRGGDQSPPPPDAPPPSPTATAEISEFASAHDDDPVTLLTREPTCADWEPINERLKTELANGWLERDPTVPGSAWTAAQREQHLEVARALRAAADNTAPLAKATPHRVMRELYGQLIAYWRSYADAVDRYRPPADHLALAATHAAEAINGICAAIDFGAAGDRSPLVVPGPPPVPDMPLGDPDTPTRYITKPSPFCSEWVTMVADYATATTEWRERHDPNVPARYWSPEQRKLADDVAGVMEQNADRAQLLGLLSGNLIAADFAALSAQYRRAYAAALPDFALPDIHLDNTALRLQALTNQACQAVQQ